MSDPTLSIWYAGNDMVLRVSGLANRSGALINDADVSVTNIEDEHGRTVDGVTLPVTAFFSGTDGQYEAQIPSTAVVRNGVTYFLTVQVVSGGVTASWRERAVCKWRVA